MDKIIFQTFVNASAKCNLAKPRVFQITFRDRGEIPSPVERMRNFAGEIYKVVGNLMGSNFDNSNLLQN